MSTAPADEPKPAAADEHDDAADAMNDRLRKDVASWREGRSDGSARQATELSVAVARSTVPPTNARMKRSRPATEGAVPTAPAPATSGKKPFGMSYDGTSRADYIKLMVARGAR